MPGKSKKTTVKIPWRTLSEIAGVLSLIAVVVAIYIAHVDADKLYGGFAELKGDKIFFDGAIFKAPTGPIQIKFWTPSVRTKELANIKDWEKLSDETRLNEFGDELVSRKIVEGYRRYEVPGKGRGPRQRGT